MEIITELEAAASGDITAILSALAAILMIAVAIATGMKTYRVIKNAIEDANYDDSR